MVWCEMPLAATMLMILGLGGHGGLGGHSSSVVLASYQDSAFVFPSWVFKLDQILLYILIFSVLTKFRTMGT